MAVVATKRSSKASKASKAGKGAKALKPAPHPSYADMVTKAIIALGDKKGSSGIAIKKYILGNFPVQDNKNTNGRINVALRIGVLAGKLVTARGHAATYKIPQSELAKKAAMMKIPEKKAVKKTPAKKTPMKKSSAKKVSSKKSSSSKKRSAKRVWVWRPGPSALKKAAAKKPGAKRSLVKKFEKK